VIDEGAAHMTGPCVLIVPKYCQPNKLLSYKIMSTVMNLTAAYATANILSVDSGWFHKERGNL
jgi:hypothetical protein